MGGQTRVGMFSLRFYDGPRLGKVDDGKVLILRGIGGQDHFINMGG